MVGEVSGVQEKENVNANFRVLLSTVTSYVYEFASMDRFPANRCCCALSFNIKLTYSSFHVPSLRRAVGTTSRAGVSAEILSPSLGGRRRTMQRAVLFLNVSPSALVHTYVASFISEVFDCADVTVCLELCDQYL